MVRLLTILPLIAAVLAQQPGDAATEVNLDSNTDLNTNAESTIGTMTAPQDVSQQPPPKGPADTPAQAPAQAPPASQAPAPPGIITAAQAQQVVDSAIAKAGAMKIPSNIAVTDPYGHLVAFTRMDGAVLVSIDVALKKAKTVSLFNGRYRSGDLFNQTSPGGSLYGLAQTNDGLVFLGGGVPLKLNDKYVGALGVSGGDAKQDAEIASAAATALK